MRAQLLRAAEFVRNARSQDPDALVFVHCQSGVNRAPSVAMAVMITEERSSLLVAFSEVRRARPSVRPKYIKEVALYEEAILGTSSTPALRDGPNSSEFCAMYYGLKNDHTDTEPPQNDRLAVDVSGELKEGGDVSPSGDI
uniref:Tyrosine specific protein phosphatases domain-containing protein n=2 Tax=Octactis speculum TaxID=3111310 RepID=A0A7S2G777_9STRA|mmetsp:Transcript_40598/g.55269  ORF Transcript_40598/g.55269 Transcript_40598/m.55269 type:complete len:141 (+) Transcript_40598:163-585(+)